MDLRNYVDSEIEEDAALGETPPTVARTDDGDYPGDPEVLVPSEAVTVRELLSEEGGVTRSAYVALPSDTSPAPGVLVIHENKGLDEYTRNTVRRLAAKGFAAAAPDLLARVGGSGSFAEPADATAAIREIEPDDIVDDVRTVLREFAKYEEVDDDRLGIIGFCFGGGIAWRVMTKESRLSAGVPYYGPGPDEEDMAGIRSPILAIYGALDERITSLLPGIRAAMERHDKDFDWVIYSDAKHAFHNDANPARYHPEAAREAWDRTLDFLAENLGSEHSTPTDR